MKKIGLLFLSIVLIFIGAFISGFIYMEVYELGIAPIVNYLDNAPHIPYMYFVLIAMVISVCAPGHKTKYEISDIKFWGEWVGTIITKFISIFILWIFNITFF